jgi:hypothetical protein
VERERPINLYCPVCRRGTHTLPVGHRFSDVQRDADASVFMEMFCEDCNYNWLVIARVGKKGRG